MWERLVMAISNVSSPPPGWGPRGLDRLLDAFSTGHLSEIVGPGSSGASSLLLALVARATAAGGQVAFVDGPDAFDPASAVHAGADLSRLLWVKCGGRLRAAFSAADLLVRCPGFSLVALDLGEPLAVRETIPPARWLRLKLAVEQSDVMVVLRAPRRLAGSAAALAVSLRPLEPRWIGRPSPPSPRGTRGDPRRARLAGLGSEVRILRARPPSTPAREREGIELQWQT